MPLCLANGAFECWIVDPAQTSVTVTLRDGATVVYGRGEDIPLTAFGSDKVSGNEVFAGLR